MAPVRRSAVKVNGGGAAPPFSVDVRITGVEKTSDDFKQARRDVNRSLRVAQRVVGERVVLPAMRQRMRAVSSSFASTLVVKPDRLDVYIGSTLRGPKNRALGWLDFGGQRPRDTSRRQGPYIMARTLQSKQPQIRDEIRDAVLAQFRQAGFDA